MRRFAHLKQIDPNTYQVRAIVSGQKPPQYSREKVVEAPPSIDNARLFQLYYHYGKWIERKEFVHEKADGKFHAVRWVGPLLDGSGYASASRNCVAALNEAGVQIQAKAVSFEAARADYGRTGEIVDALLGRRISYTVNIVHMTPENFRHHWEPNCYNIGAFCWETDVLPREWVPECNRMDEIWVPCRWTADVCIRSGVTVPVRVFGYCLPVEDYADVKPYRVPGVDPSWYKFYSIFQWTERKNPQGLLRAYFTAFTEDDPVILILKTYRSNYSKGEQEAIRAEVRKIRQEVGGERPPKIILLLEMMTHAEILGLHRFGDCFVLPHRSEGWGMPHMEACMMGKPVITTAYGANLEFTLPEHSYLIGSHQIPVSGMPWIPWYKNHMTWAEPSVDECREFMRRLASNPSEGKEKGRRAQEFVLRKFSRETVGRAMRRRLECIWGRQVKVTLGMIVRNDERFLSMTLPLIRDCFDEFVAVDAESSDRTREILKAYGAKVIVRPWNNNYSDARNEVIRNATGDWMFMLDSDEAMFPEDIEKVRKLMEQAICIRLPRIEFVTDGAHVDETVYPDWQGRVFALGNGFHFRNRVHEILYKDSDGKSAWEMGYFTDAPDCPIYHYGQCRSREEVWLKHHNYRLIQNGLPPLDAVPPNVEIKPCEDLKPFTGDHPLKGMI